MPDRIACGAAGRDFTGQRAGGGRGPRAEGKLGRGWGSAQVEAQNLCELDRRAVEEVGRAGEQRLRVRAAAVRLQRARAAAHEVRDHRGLRGRALSSFAQMLTVHVRGCGRSGRTQADERR